MIRVGVTATRRSLTNEQIANITYWIDKQMHHHRISELHHGMCPYGGGDHEIEQIATRYNIWVVGHPSLMEPQVEYNVQMLRKPKDFLERDRDIVDETDYLIVAPWQNEKPKSLRGQGTWYTENYARGGNSKIMIYYPDGRVE